MKVWPCLTVSTRLLFIDDIQYLSTLVLVSGGDGSGARRLTDSPGHWILSVCCQGSRDKGFNAGRSQRNRWLASDWLAGIKKISEHQPATS